jgi:two-component system, response regulator
MLRRLLLVENNMADEKLALFAFKKNDLLDYVDIARNGLDALLYLLGDNDHLPADLPQLVILDLKMPVVTGIEVLREIRAHQRTSVIPVIIFTSSLEPSDVNTTYRLGANSYIRKPIDLKEFNLIVYNIKQYWFHINHSPLNSPTSISK